MKTRWSILLRAAPAVNANPTADRHTGYITKMVIQDFSCEGFSPHTLKWYTRVISSEKQKATSAPWKELPDPALVCVTNVGQAAHLSGQHTMIGY